VIYKQFLVPASDFGMCLTVVSLNVDLSSIAKSQNDVISLTYNIEIKTKLSVVTLSW